MPNPKKRVPSYNDPDWGVCQECGEVVAWPGRGVVCDCCEADCELTPSDDRGNVLPKPKVTE